MFNLTYHRHQTSTTNYENSITRAPMGSTMLNCIIDFNNVIERNMIIVIKPLIECHINIVHF